MTSAYCTNTTMLDLTSVSVCTQDILSTCLPCLMLVLCFPNFLLGLRTRGRRENQSQKKWTPINMLRLFLSPLTLSLDVLFRILLAWDTSWSLVSLLVMTCSIISLLLTSCYLVTIIHRTRVTSKTLFFFWFFSSLCHFPYLFNTNDHLWLVIVYQLLLILQFVLQWFPYSSLDTSSEDSTSFASSLVFNWLTPMFIKGFSGQLQLGDIPSLPKNMDVRLVIDRFNKAYQEKEARIRKDWGLLWILGSCFGRRFLTGSFFRFTSDILSFFSVFILQKILQVIEQDNQTRLGIIWCCVMLVSRVVQNLTSHQSYKKINEVGLQMRTVVMSFIFKKSLQLSSAARQEYTTGEMTNLVALDCQKLADVLTHINVIWSAPLKVFIAMYFLFNLVGVSAFAGMAILFVLIPVNLIGNRIGKTIQQKQMELKDQRILGMTEILQGIKVIKYYAWEKPFMKRVNEIREKEIASIKKNFMVYSMMNVCFSSAPLLVTLCTFGVFITLDPVSNILTAEKVFSCMAIFNLLRIDLFLFPLYFMEAIKLMISVKRINKFLRSENIEINKTEIGDKISDTMIKLKEASFSWDKGSGEKKRLNILSKINLTVKKGELVGVIGKVGSGKSSLLSAILGEMRNEEGMWATKATSVAFVSQEAWIQNMTIKDNILFDLPLERVHYEKVVDACALSADMEILPGGDETEIGEKGINLSGGQKQRVALARAAYRQSDLVLMDDPLSAVDAHVSKHLFQNLIGPAGILKESTRIIVTHSTSFLKEMDKIVMLDDGKIILQGHYDEIKDDPNFQVYKQESKQSTDEEEHKTEISHQQNKGEVDKLISEEDRQEGRVGLLNYIHYFRLLNLPVFLFIVFLYLVGEAIMAGCNLVLAAWTDRVTELEMENQHMPLEDQYQYMSYYGALNACLFVTSFVYNTWGYLRMARASAIVHSDLLDSMMHAPLSFFETNPSGRIINRFTSDLDEIDNSIPFKVSDVIWCLANISSVMIMISVIIPYIIIAIIPIFVCLVGLHICYTRTGSQTKRYESVAKAPILSLFSEVASGAVTIRALKQQGRFQKEFEKRIEHHLTFNYTNEMCNRWLAVLVEGLGNLLIFLVAIITFFLRSSVSAGMAGLSITYSMMILDALTWTLQMLCELETASVAIERIREYGKLEQEAPWYSEEGQGLMGPAAQGKDEPGNYLPAMKWPTKGALTLDRVGVRYRPDLPEALSDLTLKIVPGEKVGVCGRTGAGKSTLASLLLRILEPHRGQVVYDGVDTALVGLQKLRSSITIVPQDSVMFSGTLRFNLDPWSSQTEDQLMIVLDKLGLVLDLDLEVTEGGANLSMGQRQLICLGRAILRKSQLLILDEATSAMDIKTDQKITELVQQEFSHCTVLTIAHRLSTIMSGDRVCVMDKGQMVEEGKPQVLVRDKNSRFGAMARDAGISQEPLDQ